MVHEEGAPMSPDIRDIHDIIGWSRPWLFAVFAGGAALLLAAVAWLVRRLRRRRPRTPAELALAALDEARARSGSEPPDRFAFAVSAALRQYIEDRFALKAPTRTTEEFLHELATPGSALAAHRDDLGDFLAHCDRVKFGAFGLSHPQIEALHERGRRFVLMTATPPAAAPERTAS
jgi:hypothetical protein